MPRAIDFFKLVLYKLFHFRQLSYDDFFLTKTVLPIFPISPHDVISFLLPNGQQDKKNGRLLKKEEAKKPLFCTSHDGPTRSVSF